jgi:very-short-patch-repair endonuclease
MDSQSVRRSPAARAWRLAAAQHWVISRAQLIEVGFHPQAIKYRVRRGRLHRTPWKGVYAVGRPQLTRHGYFKAALLAVGDGAVLSHRSAAEVWGLLTARLEVVEVLVPANKRVRQRMIVARRRSALHPEDVMTPEGLRVTSPTRTLIDLALNATGDELEDAIRRADKDDLVSPELLRSRLARYEGEPGVAAMRKLLDRSTYTVTDSALERLFLPIARRAGLPRPLTQQWLNGFRVDFYWPDLGLVVETDGLRYHRTAQQQTVDRRRDQAHVASGLTVLRFSRAQVRFEPRAVEATLRRVIARLATAS